MIRSTTSTSCDRLAPQARPTRCSGRQYFALALDPTKCGGQNSPQNAACEYWRLPGVPGDEKGPATTVPIN